MNASTNTSLPESLARLVKDATRSDRQPPFSDQSLIELGRGERTLLEAENGAAIMSHDELELVIDPAFRLAGHGTHLIQKALAAEPSLEYAWAHGDHPGSRALAARFGFAPVRTLLRLASPLDPIPAQKPTSLHVRSFRPGADDAAWLALNAAAFHDHPEQGRLTQSDLDVRTSEHWFNADDFLMLIDGDELVGFCWLKVEPPIGEFYAVGISPDRQGHGLGRVLMDAGVARLIARGIRTAILYVEADNEPALALYRAYGFVQDTIDVRYRRNVS